jgi:hyperosmotically inducible protein
MPKHIRLALTALGLSVLLAGAGPAAQSQAKSTIEEIRKELLQLPYYGVFDFIAFSYNKGTVTLMGYAYHLGLKNDAERAVKRVSGVDTVVDKIEELPPSPNDDELRWKIYYAIYRDPFLSRYAPGGGMLWGHRHAFGGAFSSLGPGLYPGMEPAGDYPIHIIVKNMRVTLLGVVDNDGDKTIAEMKARQVPGSFEVKNELMVEKASNKS